MDVTLDANEELREKAVANLEYYQAEMRRWRNKKVQPRVIRIGEMLLCKVPKGQVHTRRSPNGKDRSW